MIAADTRSEVVVTNTFLHTQIDVTKVIDGLGAALYGQQIFRVSLECTRDVNGATIAVVIPGGATRDLTPDSEPVAYLAHYTGLPVDASCELTETLTGGADESVVDPGNFHARGDANGGHRHEHLR